MYEYLRSWTGVAVRPAPGALKNTGVINELLLGRRPVRSALEKREAANTFTGLMNEFDMKLINGMAQGPLYRLLTLTAVQQASFVKDQIYVSPCFEAYSKDRLVPGGNFAAANSRFVIIDKTVPGPDLADFNAAQKEILIRPGTLWAVSAKRTNGAVLEIGLTYIGTTAADRTRAEAIARKKGIA